MEIHIICAAHIRSCITSLQTQTCVREKSRFQEAIKLLFHYLFHFQTLTYLIILCLVELCFVL